MTLKSVTKKIGERLMIYITRKFLIILISIGVCSPFMLFAKDFPKSCKEIKELNHSSLSGTYMIAPDGNSNKPVEAYCDMESDKVGLTFYLVKNGITTRKVTDNDSCQELGLEIFAPRTKEDYENARKYLLSINAPLSFGPLGVYHPTHNQEDWFLPFGWASFTPMNSKYAGSLFGWKSTAGDTWWISDSTDVFEPNGDYYKGCWLGISYDNSGKVDWYNDEQCDFSYDTYLCMSADNYAPPSSPSPCQLYAVQDNGLNDSQFFTINPNTLEVKALGKYYLAHDIEALDAHPDTDVLYAASGDDTERPGYLYKVNAKTGELIKIGSTGFAEIEGLSFHTDGTLWGLAKGDGLVQVNPETAVSKVVVSTDVQVEDLTWNNDGTLLYIAQDTHLWVYDRVEIKKACDLPGHTEALEMLPNNTLLVGMHGQKKLLDFQVIDLETCKTIIGVGIPTEYDDVEGIAWPAKACTK